MASGSVRKGGQGGRAGKAGSHRKGSTTGSGGHGKDKLAGRGATPPAEMRPGHPAARRAAAAAKKKPAGGGAGGVRRNAVGLPASGKPASGKPATAAPRSAAPGRRREAAGADEVVAGRNPVAEAMRAGVPARSLLLATGLDHDDRVTEALRAAEAQGVPVRETSRHELDRLTDGAPHQGVALVVSPYSYAHPDDVLGKALQARDAALLVALDGVTDPRNLGAAVRSAAAFGAHGVVVPERRAAGVTAAAWKASAGAAARIPVARATNLPRALNAYAKAGVTVLGLAADGDVSLDDLEVAIDPVCVVVGSEGRGLGRLVAESCDLLVSIPMPGGTESLNASVALSVVLAEIARRRRVTSGGTGR